MIFYPISALINAIASIIVCVIAITKNPKSKLNRSFSYFAFSVAFWAFCYFFWQISNNANSALFWCKALMMGAIFIPSSFLHFSVTLIGQREKYSKVVIFWYILSIFFLLLNFTPLFVKDVKPRLSFSYWPTAGITYVLFLVMFIGLTIYAHVLMYKSYRKLSGIKRNQIKYVFLGTAIGFLGGSTNYFLWYDIQIPPLGNVLVAVYVLLIAFAIIRYRLMDVYIAVRKTAVYGALVGFVIGIVALVTFAGQQFFAQVFTEHQWVLSLISVAIITSTFRPLQIALRRFIDRFLFHHRYVYRDALKVADKELSKVKDLRSLLVMTIKVISNTLAPDHAAIFIKDRKENKFDVRISKGKRKTRVEEIKSNNSLIRWLSRYKTPVVYEELKYRLESEDFKHKEDEQKEMEQTISEMENINANACVPSFYKQKLSGGLILGNRVSGNMYTQEDLDLLQALANHTASVIDDFQVQREKDNLTVDVIAALVKTMEAKDSYTCGHSERVTDYALEIAKKLKDKPPFRRVFELEKKVHYAGLMHDVGKIGIPDSILHKPDKLTEDEYRIIKEHPRQGAEIIGQIRALDKDIIEGVLHHHERWDGRGYPGGLAGQKSPPVARILGVADAYDAMTTNRAYRNAFTVKYARKELKKESGRQFDPQVAEAFLKK
ncbi:MAG: HD domain-containing protein [Candidatus Omnitrophica bacterium]|nr:HD domain-containing protein [Candidatus Omnitrophota bacterium]